MIGLSSCSWRITQVPARVVYQRGAPESWTTKLKAATDAINEAVGCRVFQDPMPDHVTKVGVNVLYHQDRIDGGQARGRANFCSVYVGSRDKKFELPIMVHELLHCLGVGHQYGDWRDVMSENVSLDWNIGDYRKALNEIYCIKEVQPGEQ